MEENAAAPILSPETLWELLRQRNQFAFERLYRTFYRELYGYARRLVRQDQEAQNQVQELFLHLWEKHSQLPLVASVRAYLLVALRRRLLRRTAQEKLLMRTSSEDSSSPDCFTFSAEDFWIAGEYDQALKEELVRAINALPVRQREIIYLRYYQELSIAEIADALSMNYQSVANCLQRAYAGLRQEKALQMLLLADWVLLPILMLVTA